VGAWSIRKKRKVFFSEEKKQKTFSGAVAVLAASANVVAAR
jgi:hypothetical protein